MPADRPARASAAASGSAERPAVVSAAYAASAIARAARSAGIGFATLSPSPTATHAGRGTLPAGLAEDAAQLPSVEHEVVGPLELDGDAGAQPLRGRADRRAPPGGSAPRAPAYRSGRQQHAEPESAARRTHVRPRLPRPAVCSAATPRCRPAHRRRQGVQHILGGGDGARAGAAPGASGQIAGSPLPRYSQRSSSPNGDPVPGEGGEAVMRDVPQERLDHHERARRTPPRIRRRTAGGPPAQRLARLLSRSSRAAAAMTGTARKKENSVAAVRERPRAYPPMIVAPDRETPGKSASIWASPIAERRPRRKVAGVGHPLHRLPALDERGSRRRRRCSAQRHGDRGEQVRLDPVMQQQARRPPPAGTRAAG